MTNRILRLGLTALLLGVAHAARAEDTASLIAQADAAYAKREDPAQAKSAMDFYRRAAAADPKSIEACWKASRAAWWMGDQSEARKDRLNFFQEGIDWAKKAIALDPNAVEGHYWLGGNYGSFGDAKGVLKSLFLIKPIRHEMAEVNRINDKYDGGGAYRLLGIVDYDVPGFAGGNRKRAKQELEKTFAIDPSNPYTIYYLAEFYYTGGDKAQAKTEVGVLNSLQVPADDLPDLHTLQKRAQKFL